MGGAKSLGSSPACEHASSLSRSQASSNRCLDQPKGYGNWKWVWLIEVGVVKGRDSLNADNRACAVSPDTL